jgi:antitoxin (DNA-binding transcriptional repressor) of toxin-antitoxin stability system
MTLKELEVRVEEILASVQKSGRPVIVTWYGRYLAAIEPLNTEGEESTDE